jgi:hypothetical protein
MLDSGRGFMAWIASHAERTKMVQGLLLVRLRTKIVVRNKKKAQSGSDTDVKIQSYHRYRWSRK